MNYLDNILFAILLIINDLIFGMYHLITSIIV